MFDPAIQFQSDRFAKEHFAKFVAFSDVVSAMTAILLVKKKSVDIICSGGQWQPSLLMLWLLNVYGLRGED